MKKQNYLLDRVSVEKPCAADWNKMLGNDEVRFCEHCAKSVHNLSLMTRKEAEKLVKKSNGNLCIRYYKDKNKKIAVLDAPVKITRLGRRVSQFAASIFTAAISVSGVAAQTETTNATPENSVEIVKPEQAKTSGSGTSSIKGTVYDIQKAVVPNATVSLLDKADNVIYQISTNEEGNYEFNFVPAGSYKLRVEVPGFNTHFADVSLQETDVRTMDATLNVSYAVAGGAMVGESQITEWVRHSDKRDNIESNENEKLTEFFEAIDSDEIADVKEMLREGFAINTKNSAGETALMKVDSKEMTQYLLRRKADVNASNSYNETALMLKATDAEIVKVLIGAKADVNAASSFGDTPLMYAMQNDDDAKAVLLLLKAGAEPNVKDIDGRTALMLGAYGGEVEIIKALVEAGADINARDNNGKTILMYAVSGYSGDETEIIKYLIEKGADMFARDFEGKTALKYALEEENDDTVKLLKSYGAPE